MATRKNLKIGLLLDTTLDLEDGVQQYVMTMGEWLRGQGHDVHYLVGQTEHRQLPNIHSLSRNVVVRFNGNRINLPIMASRRKIRSLIQHEQFDVLYVQSPYHPFMAQRALLSASPKTVKVGSFNILPYSGFVKAANKLLGFWLRPSLKQLDQMLAVSPAAAQFEESVFGLPAEVSPNVFSYDVFHNAAPFDMYQDDVLTIMFLGRLVPRKGCLVLLKAVRILAQQSDVPPFRVIICGKGPLEAELKRYVTDNGLDGIIEFMGFVSDLDKPRYYASADLTVFPSSGGESFGIVLLEAMANGRTAVLAGDNPGYRSVMTPNPDLLFDPHDSAALAAKMKLFLKDSEKRRGYSVWGGKYSRQFDVPLVGQKLVALFERLLAAKKLP